MTEKSRRLAQVKCGLKRFQTFQQRLKKNNTQNLSNFLIEPQQQHEAQ